MSIIGIIILIAILSFATPYLIPSSALSNWLDENVGRPLGARVSAKGIHLKSFPYLGFSIDELMIASSSGPFQGLSILRAGRVSGTLSIAGLIDGKVITAIDAKQVTADLRAAEGGTNIEEALADMAAGEENDDGLVIKSLNVSDGEVNIWKDNSPAASLKKISLSSARVDFSGGPGANFEMKGIFTNPERLSAAGTPISTAGQALLDQGSSTLFLRGIKSAVAGSHITTDASFGYTAKPAQFDIHMASTNLNREACAVIFAFFPAWTSNFLSWSGIVSAEAFVKGSQQGFELNAGSDATLAKIGPEELFTKASGLPFKAQVSLVSAPNTISIKNLDLSFGENPIKVSGEIARGEKAGFKFYMQGEGLHSSSLNVYFPHFALADSIADLQISSDIEGDMNSGGPFAFRGLFKAGVLKIAGATLSNVEGSFERTPPPESASDAESAVPAISFPTFKADIFGGFISGNGIVSLGKTNGFNFDLVADRVDAGAVSALGGALTGASSMVIKAVSFGSDTAEIAKNLAMTGTFVSPSAVWAKANPVSHLFSPETWSAIEAMSGTKLSDAQKIKLAETDMGLENLSASFTVLADGVKISRVSWKNPQYEAVIRGEIDLSQGFAGEGEITLPKDIAGGLVLPVTFGGSLPEFTASLNQAKFEELIKSRPAAIAKPAAPAPKEKKEAKKQVAVVKPVEEAKPAPKKNQPEVKPAQQKAPPPKGPNQDEEDILKVIIGE